MKVICLNIVANESENSGVRPPYVIGLLAPNVACTLNVMDMLFIMRPRRRAKDGVINS